MGHSSQGIVKDEKGQEQPADKKRAQTVHKTDPDIRSRGKPRAIPKLSDANKSPSSKPK